MGGEFFKNFKFKIETENTKISTMMMMMMMMVMVVKVRGSIDASLLRDHPYQGEQVTYLDSDHWTAYTTNGEFRVDKATVRN